MLHARPARLSERGLQRELARGGLEGRGVRVRRAPEGAAPQPVLGLRGRPEGTGQPSEGTADPSEQVSERVIERVPLGQRLRHLVHGVQLVVGEVGIGRVPHRAHVAGRRPV